MGFIGKVVASACASAIGGGITLYFKLNVMVANWLDIAATNPHLVGIALIIAGAVGLLTFSALHFWKKRTNRGKQNQQKAANLASVVVDSTLDALVTDGPYDGINQHLLLGIPWEILNALRILPLKAPTNRLNT